MEAVSNFLCGQYEIVDKILNLMEEKGVSQTLLTSLNQDQGFMRFCIEWCAPRWYSLQDQNIEQSFDQISTITKSIKAHRRKPDGSEAEDSKDNEESWLTHLKEFSIKLLNSKAINIYGIEDLYDLKSTMAVDFDNDIKLGYINCIKQLEIPYLPKIQLISGHSRKSRMRKFLSNSFINKTNEIWISNGGPSIREVENIKIEKISRELQQILPKVVQKVTINSFEINQKQLRRIFSLCRDKEDLMFFNCKLLLDTVPDLSKALLNCRISRLDFYNCGHPKLTNWAKEPHLFENLVNALSQSEDLKKSLTLIKITRRSPPAEITKEILQKYHLDHINLSL
ncbi:unnamed protein product [Moneuplotes crassus]|uniref:Uncharacterized protein n=1 Tax=Euplotes crassus TaxID=5936 RepID=A0AAD1XMC2_EUPCR|nr:unnamed protein product [Moneuplotes crassus]